MRTQHWMKILTLAAAWCGSALAGPAIACHWSAVPGTVFETLAPLRDQAMRANDSAANKQSARRQIGELRAAARPDDPESLLRAGFWITTMLHIRVAPDTDGPALLERAAELRPNLAEYQFFAALGFLESDRAKFHQYWSRARKLAAPGSATARNMRIVEDLYRDLID